MSAVTSVEALRRLSTGELLQLFTTLEAPGIPEMQGEYSASLLAQPFWLASVAGRAVLKNPFQTWLCKAFRPVDDETGRGYNTFQQGRRVVQRYPMLTLMGPSRFDGRPAYQLIYRHFQSLCAAMYMVDEVRRVAPGLYLGMGTYGFTNAQRRTPYPFVLEGPIAPYRSDIGRRRANFEISPLELPALFAH